MTEQLLTSEDALGKEDLRDGQQPCWGAVFAMSTCTFTLVASEFMPISLMTPMVTDLKVSEGMVGQGIAISGVFAVLTSLFIPVIAGNLNRKTLLLLLTAAMGLSGAIIGLAENYAIYMFGRALLGFVIGGFWSMSAATAIRLVPKDEVAKALAIFNGGGALATVAAAPIGAYLGGTIGWRGVFLCLVPIALITLLWQWITLPSMKNPTTQTNNRQVFGVIKLLGKQDVALGMAAGSLFFMGQFALYTYVRPFLESITGLDMASVSYILLEVGVAGFVGTLLIGNALKRGFYQTLIGISVIMAAIAIALVYFGEFVIIVTVLMGLWGLTATAAPAGWWAWIARTFPDNAEAGGGLFVAVVNTAIALGSAMGGVLFDLVSFHGTFMISMLMLLVSAFFTLLTMRVQLKN